MMPAGSEDSLEFLAIDPLLDRRIADSQHLGSITRCIEFQGKLLSF
jgi:hypothetical protein